MRGHPLTLAAGILALLATVLTTPACSDPKNQLELIAAQAKTSRVSAAGNLILAFKAGQISAGDAIDFAHAKLEAGEDATQFAGAVLDMLASQEDRLPQAAEFELFWMRVGQLAFRAALMAHNNGRPDEAYTLVLAGPKRWQVERYWLLSPNHDALASIVLDENGQHAGAVARLAERSVLDGTTQEVYDKLTGHK